MKTLIYLSLVTASISFTITETKLFKSPREWLKKTSPFLGDLFSCGYCFGHWVAFGLVAVYKPKLFEFWWPLDIANRPGDCLAERYPMASMWRLMEKTRKKYRGKKMEINMPLVSCIMPTFNRRAFAGQAIEYFLRQDYPNRELIILDDGTDAIGDLVPADPRIRYLRLNKKYLLGANGIWPAGITGEDNSPLGR